MSGREFSEVGGVPAGFGLSSRDWDRLVDYVGGAFDGTPEAADVAARIADDAAWSRAYTELSGATVEVSADLAALGRTAAPIPDDIAARIDEALAAAGSLPAAGSTAGTAIRPTRLSWRPGKGGLSVVPGGRSDSHGPPVPAAARSPRRWRRWAAPVAVAAGMVAFGGLVVNLLPQSDAEYATSRNSEAGSADAPQDSGGRTSSPGPTQLFGGSGPRLAASGIDYRSDTVGIDAARRSAFGAPSVTGSERPKDRPGPVAGPEELDAKVDAGLRRLADGVALMDCLTAVAQEHGRPAASVDLVDYARFEGAPALVILFTDTAAEKWVWVAGPACGTVGVGADTRHSAKVQ